MATSNAIIKLERPLLEQQGNLNGLSPTSRTTQNDQRSFDRICDNCKSIFGKLTENLLIAYYRIGKEASQCLSLASLTTRTKPEIYVMLAEQIGISVRLIRFCIIFAQSIDESTMENIAQRGVRWEHVIVLINRGELQELDKWAVVIEAEGWSATELKEDLLAGSLPKRRGSGRKPALPKNGVKGLAQFNKLATTANNKMNSLFSDQFDLAVELLDTPVEMIDESLAVSLQAAIESMQALAKSMDEAKLHLKKVVEHFGNEIAMRKETEAEQKACT